MQSLRRKKHGHLVEGLKIVRRGQKRLWDVGESRAGIARNKNGKISSM